MAGKALNLEFHGIAVGQGERVVLEINLQFLAATDARYAPTGGWSG